jgi:hypothetical protein
VSELINNSEAPNILACTFAAEHTRVSCARLLLTVTAVQRSVEQATSHADVMYVT